MEGSSGGITMMAFKHRDQGGAIGDEVIIH